MCHQKNSGGGRKRASLKISFDASRASTNPTGDSDDMESSTIIPPDQDFDLMIGADGMHSQIRTGVLECPPPIYTDVFVWRGSEDTTTLPALYHLQCIPLTKFLPLGETITLTYINHHSKIPGTIAWFYLCAM